MGVVHKVSSSWVGGMAFDHQVVNHTVRTDSVPPLGEDSGASPKRLLLAGLAGCSGVDVSSLLKKMRAEVRHMEMHTEADLGEEHPKRYTEIRLKYTFYGTGLKKDKIEKAVKTSMEKLCGVTAMLERNCPVKYTIEYVEED